MRWLPLLLLLGCSESIGPNDLRSGSRLELRYWHYDDGTRQWNPNVFFDRQLGSECMLQTRAYGPTFCVPSNGGVIEDKELVRVFRHNPTGDGRIQISMLTSDDGMQAPGRFYDREIDGECEPVVRDDRVICIPKDFAQAAYFRDQACSERLFSSRAFSELPSAAIVEDTAGSCDSFYAIGREVSKFPLFVDVQGTCTSLELPDSEQVYELGQRVEPALMQAQIMEGTRLRAVELGDGNSHAPAPWLFDTALGTTCMPLRLDGFALCIPPSATNSTRMYYFDGTCTAGMMGTTIMRPGCEPPQFYQYPFQGDPAPRIRELLPAPPSLFVFDDATATCIPTDVTNVRMLGRKVQLGEFVPAVPE